ncbi:hypothetical protein D3C73_1490570 [compost metagenome]
MLTNPVVMALAIMNVTGPMTVNARNPITSSATGATTSSLMESCTRLLSQRSSRASRYAETSTGSTCP